MKVQHRCKVDRSVNPPVTSEDLLSIEDLPVPPALIQEAKAIRVNGHWFVPAIASGLERQWEECAP